MLEQIIYTAKIIRTKFVSDQKYLTKRFTEKLGYEPNFQNPQSFNEKVTARMIFERNPLHTGLADKITVRDIISNRIDSCYFVPLLGTYKNFSEIDFGKLPEKFVIKCNHDSGSAIVCTDKSSFDIKSAEAKISRHLKMNMYFRKREWHYKNISPKILIEEYVDLYQDKITHSMITTCRVHCFEGKVRFIEMDIQNYEGREFTNIYDTQWKLQPFKVDLKDNAPTPLSKPQQFQDMILQSENLCFKYGYSRIDFLLGQEKVYFSEITLTPNAGRMVITPSEWDQKLGQLWQSY
ncbi:ATP-grasp fold amidoligase family protein [Acinetobacter shaoyimingii]|uniref:Glycosyltransferase n=1 Tax=Acinetobacter shaoyimingii TaxID=2715164 RepID=A0A6G8RSY9_9GAMM|nr:ATP-grasp fold amidoligase family protein [Acinetobacter shaoyimingii]QIO04987.1 glycosyltransferase [Acinetobacter shaoyimingii]